MQMTTALLIVNPCDEEEDNMAMLCCHSDQGEMFLMSRYPDEDELEIILDDEPSTLDGVKVTLSPTRLLIEIAAADADALNGDDSLEILTALMRRIWLKWKKPCRTSSRALGPI